jgi:hypothetical protein
VAKLEGVGAFMTNGFQEGATYFGLAFLFGYD